jgi:hypothetical protein
MSRWTTPRPQRAAAAVAREASTGRARERARRERREVGEEVTVVEAGIGGWTVE